MAKTLVYSMILGLDWQWFGEVMHEWGDQLPMETNLRPCLSQLLSQKEDEGPEEKAPDHSEGPESHSVEIETPAKARHEWLTVNGDFTREQREDPALSQSLE